MQGSVSAKVRSWKMGILKSSTPAVETRSTETPNLYLWVPSRAERNRLTSPIPTRPQVPPSSPVLGSPGFAPRSLVLNVCGPYFLEGFYARLARLPM